MFWLFILNPLLALFKKKSLCTETVRRYVVQFKDMKRYADNAKLKITWSLAVSKPWFICCFNILEMTLRKKIESLYGPFSW